MKDACTYKQPKNGFTRQPNIKVLQARNSCIDDMTTGQAQSTTNQTTLITLTINIHTQDAQANKGSSAAAHHHQPNRYCKAQRWAKKVDATEKTRAVALQLLTMDKRLLPLREKLNPKPPPSWRCLSAMMLTR